MGQRLTAAVWALGSRLTVNVIAAVVAAALISAGCGSDTDAGLPGSSETPGSVNEADTPEASTSTEGPTSTAAPETTDASDSAQGSATTESSGGTDGPSSTDSEDPGVGVTSTGELITVTGQVVAGPIGPDTIDGSGDDTEPVVGAVIIVSDQDGAEVARVESGAEGRFEIRLAAGRYELEPQAVEGLLGTASAQQLDLTVADPGPLLFEYDTGVR